VAALAGLAALAGAGVGAASALMFAERRASAQDRELNSLERRIAQLEQLNQRVARLEGAPVPPPSPRGPS
jgi:gas vesicle protein